MNDPKSLNPIRRSIVAFATVATAYLAQGEPVIRAYAPATEALDESGYKGTVLIYDLLNDAYYAGHVAMVDKAFLPASTFKIFSAMAALQTGVIADRNSLIAWDGIKRERTELNRDLDLQTAFRLSAVPHFQRLVRQIGQTRMQQLIDSVGYGNQDISGEIDQFWLDGDLRISPHQQVDFLARLYRNELPFDSIVMDSVKEMMVAENDDDSLIRAKTGWTTSDEGEAIGWWVGWMEKGVNRYFFATVLIASHPDSAFGPSRKSITRTLLNQLAITPRAP